MFMKNSLLQRIGKKGVVKCKPSNIAKACTGSPVLERYFDTQTMKLSSVGSVVLMLLARASSDQQGSYFIMAQKCAVTPWSSTVLMLKREAQTVRDSLEPANERHTAFAGMCADSWAPLDFIFVWDFPEHLEGLGTHTPLALSGRVVPCFKYLQKQWVKRDKSQIFFFFFSFWHGQPRQHNPHQRGVKPHKAEFRAAQVLRPEAPGVYWSVQKAVVITLPHHCL